MRRFLCRALPIAALFFTQQSLGQQDTLVRYFTYSLEETVSSKAFDTVQTIRSRQADGSLLEEDYFIANKRLKRRARYADAARTTLIGTYEVYFRHGQQRILGEYTQGRKSGLWKSWNEEGQTTDSVRYNAAGHMTGTRIILDGISARDSVVYAADGSGRGRSYGFFQQGMRHHVGELLDDKMVGDWTFYHRNGQESTKEHYSGDSLVNAICFDEAGNIQGGPCVPVKDAEYSKGLANWGAYIRKSIESNMRQLRTKDANGTVVVQFVIDTLGKVTNVTLLKPTGTYLDEFALKVIRESPEWFPARYHNVPIKAYRRQPISFILE